MLQKNTSKKRQPRRTYFSRGMVAAPTQTSTFAWVGMGFFKRESVGKSIVGSEVRPEEDPIRTIGHQSKEMSTHLQKSYQLKEERLRRDPHQLKRKK